ncbi:hypothetical protein QLT01_17355, partial [Cobetia amphilecti]
HFTDDVNGFGLKLLEVGLTFGGKHRVRQPRERWDTPREAAREVSGALCQRQMDAPREHAE